MSLPIPAVPAVRFDSGNDAKLYVKDIATYDATVGLAAGDELTVAGADTTFTPSGAVESIPIYGEAWDRAVKNGLSGTFSATTYAPGNNSQVSLLLAAAQAVGEPAGVVFILELSDGGYLHGAAVVNDFVPNTPVRGVFSYSFNFTTDGPVTYVAPV